MMLAATVAVVAAALGIPGRATYGMRTSGDEPHYLVTAISLAEDGDLDVSDEVADDRYRPFHERGLKPQAERRSNGALVEPHDPLLPAVVALPMHWGGFRAAKATLALMAGALAALLVWTMVRRFDVRVGAALVTSTVFTAAAPLAVYGHQVYPELPAALAVTAAVAALTGRLGRGGAVVLGATVVALPWLAVKYVPVAAALAVIGLAILWRRGDRRMTTVLAGTFGLAGVAYVLAHLAWYDGLTVYASGRFFQDNGGQVSVVGTAPNHLGRSRRLVGLLVDRGFGLAAWQPAWLLAAPALGALVRRRPRGWLSVVGPWGAGWLTATFVAATMHGWWFAGRQTVVVLPLLAIAVGWWVGASRLRLGALAVAGSLGVASYGWLAVEAAAVELTWIVDFASTSNPWYRLWRTALPDYLHPGTAMWALHVGWTVALILFAWWGWRSGRGVGRRLGGALGGAVGASSSSSAGPRARAGAGPRARARSGGLAAPVEFADGRAVVGTAGGQGQGQGEDGGGSRVPESGASHEGTSR